MSKESRIFGPERASRGDAAGDKQHQPLDSLWDENADKYKFRCRALHITRATLYIAYAQIVLTFVFWLFFMFYYLQVQPPHAFICFFPIAFFPSFFALKNRMKHNSGYCLP
ncbi:unnamed protein product [Gongylonema pulchrum]|uniref:Transmembrane protein n=1 Tax=Gongylonema pulchrum TaxID=637853 RepID=A0A183ESN0_9BILA|nr:unnamed protein product [Gongylonema pulchrum]